MGKSGNITWQKFALHTIPAYTNLQVLPPFYLKYGRQARIPIDLVYSTPEPSDQSHGEYARDLRQSLENAYSTARERLQTAAQRQKTNYDQRIHGEPFKVGDIVTFKVGDIINLHNPVVPKGKLSLDWALQCNQENFRQCVPHSGYKQQQEKASDTL